MVFEVRTHSNLPIFFNRYSLGYLLCPGPTSSLSTKLRQARQDSERSKHLTLMSIVRHSRLQVESKVLDFSADVEAIGDPPAILPPTGILPLHLSIIHSCHNLQRLKLKSNFNQSRHAVRNDACQAGFPVGRGRFSSRNRIIRETLRGELIINLCGAASHSPCYLLVTSRRQEPDCGSSTLSTNYNLPLFHPECRPSLLVRAPVSPMVMSTITSSPRTRSRPTTTCQPASLVARKRRGAIVLNHALSVSASRSPVFMMTEE